jgi:hypothetical protein
MLGRVTADQVSVQQPGEITVPGRKLLDIVRTLPEKTNVTLTREGEKVVLRGGPCVADTSAAEKEIALIHLGDRGNRNASRSGRPLSASHGNSFRILQSPHSTR